METTDSPSPTPGFVVLYDGECGFCQYWVWFLIDRDRHHQLRFAPLQGEWFAMLLAERGWTHPGMESMLAWDGRSLTAKADAAIAIATALPWPWRGTAFLLRCIPRNWRNRAYDAIARRRHRLSDACACRMPTPEERTRFLI